MSLKDVFNRYQNELQKGANERAELDKFKPQSPWPELMLIMLLAASAWHLYSIYKRDEYRLNMFKSKLSNELSEVSYAFYSRYAAKVQLDDGIIHNLDLQDIQCLMNLSVYLARRPPSKENSKVNHIKLPLETIDVYIETRQYEDTLNVNGWMEQKDGTERINFDGFSQCSSTFLASPKNT